MHYDYHFIYCERFSNALWSVFGSPQESNFTDNVSCTVLFAWFYATKSTFICICMLWHVHLHLRIHQLWLSLNRLSRNDPWENDKCPLSCGRVWKGIQTVLLWLPYYPCTNLDGNIMHKHIGTSVLFWIAQSRWHCRSLVVWLIFDGSRNYSKTSQMALFLLKARYLWCLHHSFINTCLSLHALRYSSTS